MAVSKGQKRVAQPLDFTVFLEWLHFSAFQIISAFGDSPPSPVTCMKFKVTELKDGKKILQCTKSISDTNTTC